MLSAVIASKQPEDLLKQRDCSVLAKLVKKELDEVHYSSCLDSDGDHFRSQVDY